MEIFFPSISTLFFSLIILPIPIGYAWVWVYAHRRRFNLPDWFAGILADGIIRGHKITKGKGTQEDAVFIIVATLITTYLAIVIISLIWMIGAAIVNI